jgi:hypothetical protein
MIWSQIKGLRRLHEELCICSGKDLFGLAAEQRLTKPIHLTVRRRVRITNNKEACCNRSLHSSTPRPLRTPSSPPYDFDNEPFDQPSDNDQSKYGCEKYRHAFDVCISSRAQSRICLVLSLLIFRLICRFPFCSILLRSQSLQCIILGPQSVITHTQLRAVKPVAVPCFKNPRIYPDTHKSEHRQNDTDLLPTIQPYPHFCAPNARLRVGILPPEI